MIYYILTGVISSAVAFILSWNICHRRCIKWASDMLKEYAEKQKPLNIKGVGHFLMNHDDFQKAVQAIYRIETELSKHENDLEIN